MYFDEHLTFNAAVSMLSDSAGRALGKVIYKFKTLKNVSFKAYTKLYESCVVPIVDYCAGVWGHRKYTKCDNIHNRALRYFYGVPVRTPIPALQGDSGWLLPKFRHYLCVAKLWNRFIGMNPDRLTKQIFWFDVEVTNGSWASSLAEILERCDMHECFDSRSEIDMHHFKNKIIEQMNTEWHQNVLSKPKLRTYMKFKTNYEAEKYVVDHTLTRRERSLLSHLRFGILPLKIETGRYYRIPPHERFCELCETIVEDELHFVLNCPAYNICRDTMNRNVLDKCEHYMMLTEEEKLKELMDSHHKILTKYILSAWDIRTHLIYV